MTKRDKAIEYGYDLADWIGAMALAYSPVMIFVIMALATMSIALRGGIATNGGFDVVWAIATAICIDGLWLGVWLRVRGYKISSVATFFKYLSMLAIALFMLVVGVAMSILITYQQVNGVTNELQAMGTLRIDSLSFVVARGFLVMLCATLAIFFREEKREAISEKKARATVAAKTTAKVPAVAVSEDKEIIAIPEHSEAIAAATVAMDTGTMAIARSPEYEKIKATMAKVIEDGKLTANYQVIAIAAEVGYSTVKKWAPEIKKELGILGD